MNNNLLQIKIKQRLNKLASFDYDNIECWQIQEAVNKAQLEWIRRQIYGINTRKEGSEQSTGLVDDLQVLLKSKKVDPVDKKYFYEGELPDDYLYYVRLLQKIVVQIREEWLYIKQKKQTWAFFLQVIQKALVLNGEKH
jgi:hypothetical protein